MLHAHLKSDVTLGHYSVLLFPFLSFFIFSIAFQGWSWTQGLVCTRQIYHRVTASFLGNYIKGNVENGNVQIFSNISVIMHIFFLEKFPSALSHQ